MWIITKNGVARNVDDIGVLSVVKKDDGKFDVVPFLKHEDRALATFDNAADAQNFIENLVNELNGNKHKLGYAFTWLAKVEQLPPDKKSEFDKIAQILLNSLGEPETCIADDSQYYKLAENEDEVIFAPKPKKFNDDGIEW